MSTPDYAALLNRWVADNTDDSEEDGGPGPAFVAKIQAQPFLLERAVDLARHRQHLGNKIVSHRWLVETLRLEDEIKPLPGEEYGLSNTYGRPLALLIMALNDDLAGYIRTNDA